MHRTNFRSLRGERGTSTVEWIGLGVAVALCVVALGPALAGWGGGDGARRIAQVVGQAAGQARVTSRTPSASGMQFMSASPRSGRYFARFQRDAELRRSIGEGVGDDLALRPIGTPWARWQAQRTWRRRGAHTSQQANVAACAACAGVAYRGSTSAGGSGQGSSRSGGVRASDGLGLHVRGQVYAALAAVEARYGATAHIGPLGVRGQLQGSGTVGGELSGRGAVRLGRTRQQLDLDGTAVVGAAARAEARASVELLGVGVQATGGAEGWAGAGATGGVLLDHHGSGVFTVRLRGGAALGLGGALDASATVDVSEVAQAASKRVASSAAQGRAQVAEAASWLVWRGSALTLGGRS